jgi:hypothetical protein
MIAVAKLKVDKGEKTGPVEFAKITGMKAGDPFGG